jgi:cell division protein ZapA
MKNKVTVSIAGQEYTMVAVEDESYVRKVAAHVDGQVREVLDQGRLSIADSAVLAAMNIADQYFREVAANENLRRQIKEGLEESAKLKSELSECKREIFKLQNNRK